MTQIHPNYLAEALNTLDNLDTEVFVFPASFSQERLWFIDKLEPGSSSYNITIAYRLSGILNVTALEQSLRELVNRHASLRTTFASVNGELQQLIYRNIDFTLPIIDLRELPEAERETESQRLAQQEAQQPFDLATIPLFRFKILQLTSENYILLIASHQIVFDSWSRGVFNQELAALYQAFSSAKPSPLPKLPIQYPEYAVWQHEWLKGEFLDSQLDYWKKQLGGNLPILQLPTDYPRPPIQTYSGKKQFFLLSPEFSQSLQQLSQESGATLFMILLAAFYILLYRYSGQEDIIIATSIPGRNRVETEGLIGFFVNTLALRTNLAGNPNFRELLERVREVTLGAYAHQDLHFEKLLEELQPERNTSHSPLFQVMFLLQNTPDSALEISGLTIENFQIDQSTANFDLTLAMWETPQGISGTLEYNTDLFEDATITRILGHFPTLLAGIVANPSQEISTLPLLTAAEKHQLLVEWNNTAADYPQDTCIHQLFESQVERTPDAIAVVFEDQRLTYRELNNRANQLAHYLEKLGVKPEVLVGICVERSLEMVVGLLAILKAGGAYVPLDPVYPQDRIAFMLEDTQIQVLLTTIQLVETLPSHQAKVICLDRDWTGISNESPENLISTVQLSNLGYVIYTSGSTGKPKGVAMMQLPLFNLILWHLNHPQLGIPAKTVQFAPLSFDVSFQEIFSTWCSGGTLVLISEEMRRDAMALLRFLHQNMVERLFLPFVALQQLAEVAADSDLVLTNLSEIITAGEQLQITPAIALWFSQLPASRLHNHYGPSESHVVTAFTLTSPVSSWSNLPPIGCPIDNTQIYILDSHLQPVPIGIPGELYIGGDGLARGYLNRPELTAEKFIPNSFDPSKSARLYKTGDLSRYLPDGNIEYLGRIDNQVKIRGFRIELGEIESVLAQDPHVRETVVIAREDVPGDKRLVAYIIPQAQPAPTTDELRRFLKQQLPDYMVPSAFVILDAFPLTPSGKLDRRALPLQNISTETFSDKFVAPRTPTEEIIANIWAEVLRLNKVGIRHNFFELGGHSLLGTQVISRCQKAFGIELPLRTLFERPTVAELSQSIEKAKTDITVNLPLLVPISRVGKIPLSFTQTKLWFLDQLTPNSATYNIPDAERFKGVLNLQALSESLLEIIRRHESLRSTFTSVDGEPSQIISETINFTLPVINLENISAAAREEEASRLTTEEAQEPFNLAIGPLVRAKVLRLASDDHILLLTLHHIISDGWSLGILRQELAALYEAFSSGKPSPLPELPIQYPDFTVWQRSWLEGEILASQLDYWKEQLGGQLPVLELPTDYPRPPIQTYSGKQQSLLLSPELSSGIKQLSQKSGVTLFMTLLAAFYILLFRYSRQEDIIIGTPVAGRNRLEIEGLIGFFVNTLALRTNLGGNPSFEELLERVREVTLGALAHQDLSFEKLVEELQPERDMSRSPLFQVMFVLENTPQSTCELPDLTLSTLEIDNGTAKFDLTISLTESSEEIKGTWEYNTDLFDTATITRMIGHFQTLLEGIVANPSQSIAQLPLLTEAERHQLLVEWNNTQTDYPQDKCIHQLFEEQVEQTPDAVAVVFGEKILTYQELNNRANQLAHYLQKFGVKPETFVGICLERSWEMIVGMLGIIKAGGVYVPLDPTYPQQRITFMLSNAQVPILLTQKYLLKQLPASNIQVICLDSDWEIINQNSQENLLSPVMSIDLAYVIYTSGSTGQPKGVAVSHKSAINLATALDQAVYHHQDYPLRVSLNAPLSFDPSVQQIVQLLYGHTLYILPDNIRRDGDRLLAYIRDHSLDVLDGTPSHIKLLLAAGLNEINDGIPKLVLLGGEPLDEVTWKSLASINNTHFYNVYGPTECTVDTTSCLITKELTKPTIGRPLANAEIYILDAHLQPLPIGVPGEIYIGGDGLARGYLNRPELTAEKFITNPFNKSKRLYKTGDLARYLADGNIEFIGRIDSQVKIRGFRIELGEIESVIAQATNVQETVVIVREDVPGDKRLVSYIIPNQEIPITDDLRRFLKERLPDYMIPSAFVIIDAFPLTPNGKVDRRALPLPEYISYNDGNNLIAPRDELEQQLTQLWEKVLNVKPISISSNFFDLGGHSLLAVKLFAQIGNILNKDLPISTLFQAPTIAELANIIRQEAVSISRTSLVAIQPKGSKKPFFFHGGSADALSWAKFASLLDENQPFYALQRPDLDGKEVTEISVKQLAAICLKEIKTVQPKGPYLLGGHCFGGTVAFEMAQQLHSEGEQVDLLALFDAYPPPSAQLYINRNSFSFLLINSFYKFDYWLQKTYYYHGRKLFSGGLLDKLQYIRQKLAEKKSAKQERQLGYEQLKSQPSSDKKTEHTLSHQLRYLRAEKLSEEASMNYKPQVYLGKITLLMAKKQSDEWYLGEFMGWDKLTSVEVDKYEIPGLSGNLFNKDAAPLLAEQLKLCLDGVNPDR
ncbi:MAG TPA: non-ribosomal peptide synthetase [Cyanobacteria bacterium UBA11149]|nr:non-ribosomal peptide synthetase [Cyanobacteria bacterium UBA11367]HBE60928.1 non-ribosomal peptide synthetase [Cyanobacteria bacterium UBA11366]HBK62429.1 non-ribosomal peptide synthetase [Cyanobacteria bacterium UBA11166]HBR76390.1 non-ribosomal peptide synthetase [Cyanobacteria bacterium UBA11159]HBS72045.1 non-ribosomal peptide synthetase [Cyanobacteria bacterium UBA11153]HBW92366.1 non-ribosomal peptide synthetase [Cyanobacteria bacterium UBA11149]HCA95459.1 non-ribosomal peptide synt